MCFCKLNLPSFLTSPVKKVYDHVQMTPNLMKWHEFKCALYNQRGVKHLETVKKNVMKESTWHGYRKITTSTGEPIQTAKNPAPRPARRWVITLSVKPGIFKIVCNKYNKIRINTKSHSAWKAGNKNSSKNTNFQCFYLFHLIVAS